MLGKRSRPLIKKLSDCPMNRPSDIMNNLSSSSTNTNSSPRSPLDFRIPLSLSPVASKSKNNNNNLKCSYNDHVAGVGLGIIIAGLENSNSNSKFKSKFDSSSATAAAAAAGDKILVKYALRSPSSAVRSGPVPVKSSGRTSCRVDHRFMRERGVVTEKDPGGAVEDQEDEEDYENYTFVTCRTGPNKANVTTRVYYGGGDHQPKKNITTTVIGSSKFKNSTDYVGAAMQKQKQNCGVFRISSAFGGEEDEDFDKAVESTCSDFLNNCNMCRKTLLGKDIFMYRGEKAFCSEECRQRQIARDERKENKICRSEEPAAATTSSSSSSASRATKNTTDGLLSGSPYHNYDRAQIFSAGIVAV